MIICPKCQSTSRVIGNRVAGASLIRRRKCKACDHRWSTREVSNDRWEKDDAIKRSAARREHALKAAAKKRGFDIPAELLEEYEFLRTRKQIPAREAAQMLGIVPRDGPDA